MISSKSRKVRDESVRKTSRFSGFELSIRILISAGSLSAIRNPSRLESVALF